MNRSTFLKGLAAAVTLPFLGPLLKDEPKIIRITGGPACTVTFPSSLPPGTHVTIYRSSNDLLKIYYETGNLIWDSDRNVTFVSSAAEV